MSDTYRCGCPKIDFPCMNNISAPGVPDCGMCGHHCVCSPDMVEMRLRRKFPEMSHRPKLDCTQCLGTGIRLERTHACRAQGIIGQDAELPCLCIFVDHSIVEEGFAALRDTVQSMRKEKDRIVADTCRLMAELTKGIQDESN